MPDAPDLLPDQALLHRTHRTMYITAIAWIYVAIMAAVTEPNLTAGIVTFLFWGVLPVSILLYILGSPARRRRRKAAESAQDRVHHPVRQGDGTDTHTDQ